jgi:hypothetical protein
MDASDWPSTPARPRVGFFRMHSYHCTAVTVTCAHWRHSLNAPSRPWTDSSFCILHNRTFSDCCPRFCPAAGPCSSHTQYRCRRSFCGFSRPRPRLCTLLPYERRKWEHRNRHRHDRCSQIHGSRHRDALTGTDTCIDTHAFKKTLANRSSSVPLRARYCSLSCARPMVSSASLAGLSHGPSAHHCLSFCSPFCKSICLLLPCYYRYMLVVVSPSFVISHA